MMYVCNKQQQLLVKLMIVSLMFNLIKTLFKHSGNRINVFLQM